MKNLQRRQFVRNVGCGMLLAGVGPTLLNDLALGARFEPGDESLDFGDLQGLVDLMQTSSPEALQPILVERLRAGEVDLKKLTAAAALANAEVFGGQDYVGYHAAMALVPAWEMAQELPAARRALPVLKVVFRNSGQMQNVGGASHEVLQHVKPSEWRESDPAMALRGLARQTKMEQAEQLFAAESDQPVNAVFNMLLPTIEDDVDVHRFVLAHRAMELVDIVGVEHAHTLLRQCLRHCIDAEIHRRTRGREEPEIRKLVPEMFSQYKLESIELGDRDPGDEWVDSLSRTIYRDGRRAACEGVAAAIADGVSPDVIGEAISLAANRHVLCQDPGQWRAHGATAGVHGTDAANAWRNMVRLAEPIRKIAGLIVSAYHTAAHDPWAHDPYPTAAHRERVKTTDERELLGIAEEAIRANDQPLATAAIDVYGSLGFPERAVFDLMLKYAVSEDGRLHAEKYYRTVVEEFASVRSAFRWRHLVALARVTASCYGYDVNDQKGHRAPGYEDACKLLGIPA
jgi:hypothetical protein